METNENRIKSLEEDLAKLALRKGGLESPLAKSIQKRITDIRENKA